MQLAIEAAVFDGRRHLARHRGEQREILAVERLVALLAAEREDGDRASLEHAGNEVIDAAVAPEFHFFGDESRRRNRIVERDGMAGVEARQQRRAAGQPRHAIAEPVVADRREIAGAIVGEHQRHPLDHQRFDDARNQPLAETHHVQVAVQLAREGHERAAVVVAIAVEHAIERVLHRLLHRLRQQHHHDRRHQRDDPVVIVGIVAYQKGRELEHPGVQGHARGQKGGVRETALDDHFDVA